ncbi:MAG: hypothetical protein IJ733_04550 [Lachnospiraceae bacterium]|nr:hypothetical protein [Lachnospiraceae bacterium]
MQIQTAHYFQKSHQPSLCFRQLPAFPFLWEQRYLPDALGMGENGSSDDIIDEDDFDEDDFDEDAEEEGLDG